MAQIIVHTEEINSDDDSFQCACGEIISPKEGNFEKDNDSKFILDEFICIVCKKCKQRIKIIFDNV